jgi:hypothetical protein
VWRGRRGARASAGRRRERGVACGTVGRREAHSAGEEQEREAPWVGAVGRRGMGV